MLIYGNNIAADTREKLKKRLSNSQPHLAVLLVGSYAPSHAYVGMKKKACAEVGIRSSVIHCAEDISEAELLRKVEELNQDKDVHGILIQLPLPAHISPWRVIGSLNPAKDVDGLHPENMGRLLLGMQDGFIPCTPLGIQVLLEESGIAVSGKHAVIIGRSNIVGKPLAALLSQKQQNANATVTLAHQGTTAIASLTKQADIIVAAIGVPRFLTGEMIKEGAVVIDVGMTRENDSTSPKGYRLVGDVDFDSCAPKCSAITPVPGGVGPMTVAMLLQNTCLAFERQCGTL